MKDVELPPLESVHLEVGERRLTIDQAAGLDALVAQGIRTGDEPFWAYLWPSARALVAVLADFGDLGGKRVLELGCGPAAPSLAAALNGARATATDLRKEACMLAAHNAAKNGLEVETLALDWNAPPEDLGTFDGILAADVLYDDGMLRGVLRFVRRHLAPDGMALLSDPNRVMPAGVRGAARLAGLEATSLALRPGQSLVGGVTLHRLQHRPRMLG